MLETKPRPKVKKVGESIELIYDSGAYSFWASGTKVSVNSYVDFLLEKGDLSSAYVNMDVMPGRKGMVRTPSMTEEAAQGSWKNLMIMKKAGLTPIPVYHMGERRYWLERMIGEGFPYIGLSTNITLPVKQKMAWLDDQWGYLCGDKGFPSVKVHGFGITAIPLVFKFAWYSVDSVSWRLYAAYGWVVVPRMKLDGSGYNFGVAPYVVGVSDGSIDGLKAQASTGKAMHLRAMGASLRKHVLDYFISEGFDLKQLKDHGTYRSRCNARFFKRAEENFVAPKFFQRRHGFFGQANSTLGADKPPGKFRLVFTIHTSSIDSELLKAEGLRHHLLSYVYFRDGAQPFDLNEYVKTGLIPRKTTTKSKAVIAHPGEKLSFMEQ